MRDKPEQLALLLLTLMVLVIVLSVATIAGAEPRPTHEGLRPAVRGVQIQTVPPDPVAGNCESWRPLLEKYNLDLDVLRPIMWRESRCTNAKNFNSRTRDDSLGVLQTNRWGSMAGIYDRNGIDRAFHETAEGGVAAAALLYHSCGLGPWTKPYKCPGGWPN